VSFEYLDENGAPKDIETIAVDLKAEKN